MKTAIKIVSIITLCLSSSGIWAQTNTKVTGKLKGLEPGTMVYLSSDTKNVKLKKKDRKRDIELITTNGSIILRLSDSTPLHRDNFLRLVKSRYYDSMLFHRVIKDYVIQAGDPETKQAKPGQAVGMGEIGYTVPAEFRSSLFHKKGALAAARKDNPQKVSSGSHFYIVHGTKYSDAELNDLEKKLLHRKIPFEQREIYKTIGGLPGLDQDYTVFGEVVRGWDVLDSIAIEPTTSQPFQRPSKDIRIIKARLIKRKNKP